MRVGTNPAKAATGLSGYGLHRVIIPVYIPHLEGYFQHAAEILQLCLESLRRAITNRAAVTIISNGCAPPILAELHRQFELGWIDQLLLNMSNRGKIDAAVTVARGCFEPLVTISDCDVLFKDGWLTAVETLFRTFPECGYVCPFPSPAGAWHQTSATILSALARWELGFEKVVAETDLDQFAHSIGRRDVYKPYHRNAQLIVQRNGQRACVGAGHFVCTIRREVIAGMPSGPSLKAIEGNSEALWLDRPPDQLGYWRLSTPQAWAYHMGNQPEEWMYEALAKSPPSQELGETTTARPLPPPRPGWARFLPMTLRGKFLQGLQIMRVRKIFYRSLGYPFPADLDIHLSPGK